MTMISSSSSQTDNTVETKTAGRRSYFKVIPKIHQQQNDELNIEPNYIRLKENNTSPVITYNQSSPKARLDQWKWEMKQTDHYQQQQQQQQQRKQQATNSNWISDNDDNNHDNIIKKE
ncbi:hypothetical protein DINM_003156 [Dirofilaria immitis]|nr:hypothetical protein [Dirofilaria immitis]